jgi:tetratricopeptide (TPR) repeat protein
MAAACLAAERFDEAVTWAERALVQNPHFSSALRILAASLAMLGHQKRAIETMQKVYEIEPGLTLSSLRSRMEYMDRGVWGIYSKALRRAGVAE